MEDLLKLMLENIAAGTPGILAGVGWTLFIIERYYIGPQREKSYRADLAQFKKEYKELAEKTTETISQFMTLLEVIKDRVGR